MMEFNIQTIISDSSENNLCLSYPMIVEVTDEESKFSGSFSNLSCTRLNNSRCEPAKCVECGAADAAQKSAMRETEYEKAEVLPARSDVKNKLIRFYLEVVQNETGRSLEEIFGKNEFPELFEKIGGIRYSTVIIIQNVEGVENCDRGVAEEAVKNLYKILNNLMMFTYGDGVLFVLLSTNNNSKIYEIFKNNKYKTVKNSDTHVNIMYHEYHNRMGG